jgi:2-oxo-3-hexenedioate decarboxylase
MASVDELASRLIEAYDAALTLAPITAESPDFDVAAAYEVLQEIEHRRRAQGWVPAGRKIGFTNRTIWQRYGVYQPMWAHMWTHSIHRAREGHATLALDRFVQPRIEPEVVFCLRGPVPDTDDAVAILRGVAWIAAGFEIVQSHFPDWKFKAPDCTAAFGLHGALVVGTPVLVTNANRDVLAAALPSFVLALREGASGVEREVDRGIGANVLGSPAMALAHLARVLAGQPGFAPLAEGEIVTTGTVTDAWPVAPGETWSSDYGALLLPGLHLRFA